MLVTPGLGRARDTSGWAACTSSSSQPSPSSRTGSRLCSTTQVWTHIVQQLYIGDSEGVVAA